MSRHLDRRVSALVDGQLPPDEQERALAHVATCPGCRAAVDAERAAKAALHRLTDPTPSSDLLAGLLRLGGPAGPLPPDRGGFPGAGSRPAPWAPWATSPRPMGRRAPSGPGRLARRRGLRVSLAVTGVAGASLSLAFVAGAPRPAPAPTAPAVVPAFDRFTTEHLRTTGGLPFSDPAAGAVPVAGTGTWGSTPSPAP